MPDFSLKLFHGTQQTRNFPRILMGINFELRIIYLAKIKTERTKKDICRHAGSWSVCYHICHFQKKISLEHMLQQNVKGVKNMENEEQQFPLKNIPGRNGQSL